MRVAITGGTGSLGRALIAHLARLGAERIVSVSRDEVKAADLGVAFADVKALRCFLGDVRDQARLVHAFYGCELVIHAAALKRVPQSVYSPSEMVKTNVQGTVNVLEAALAAGVERVILVSSDKAVHPTNLYGFTKGVAEHYAVQANAYAYPRGTRVAVVRYGNVLGSRGSVFETWRAAVERGEPVPITDTVMTRFLISLEDAASFVLTCAARMQGGEIFVPDLPAARVCDVASVFTNGAEQRVIGLRPGGEKLHEWLLSEEEVTRLRVLDFAFVVVPSYREWSATEYDGAPLAIPGWRYTSDDPERRLGRERIAVALARAGVVL